MVATKLFDSIIMLRFGSDKSSKKRKEILWTLCQDVDIDNIVISKLIKIKNDSKYLTKYLHEVIKPLRYLHQVIKLLILILPKIRGYVERIIN